MCSSGIDDFLSWINEPSLVSRLHSIKCLSLYHYAFIQHTFSAAGTYYIAVGEFNSFTAANGTDTPIGGNVPDAGDLYTLQVSIGDHPVAGVPDAGGALALLGGAFAMLLGFGRSRTKAQPTA